ncbi:hypothetical protein ACFPOD_03180 [Nitratireductor kimnyeongensis]|uniref:Uncharacterized protein n=1 Tax=Nitratireductor kimnyeongensis TaxID=430679 RepID=A0ABW0T555_9HYPH|nr:hypothetical protein [Nitratireductor kimnyeongensis]QZZ34891.1 hypothetical protein KW403_14005 [Nitratireductor kimnyeongensis]
MQPWLIKPLLVIMLLAFAGGTKATSLLELTAKPPQHATSTVTLQEYRQETLDRPAMLEVPLSYPAPSLNPSQSVEKLRLSPSMVGIGTALPDMHPETGETTSAIPHAPRRIPQIIRGGETVTPPPRQATAPQPTPAEPAVQTEHQPASRPKPEPDSSAAATAPASAPRPSGGPVGQPE